MKNEKIALKNNKLKHFPHHLVSTLLLAALVVATCLHLTCNNDRRLDDDQPEPSAIVLDHYETNSSSLNNNNSEVCNLFSGRWIYDDVSYPLYKEGKCSFMEDDFACEKFGRKNLKYQNWRWQPHHCDLPRFNGTALLEKIRGKRLVFVGDSLNRNQWKSMLCLIDSSLPASSKKTVRLTGNKYYYHAIEYDALIEFYWAPLLVESNCDNIEKHRVWSRIIQIKSIGKHGRIWNDADILIFDSYAWWMGPRNISVVWGSIGSPNEMPKTASSVLLPYEIALRSWSNWMEMHINRTKTKIFFMSPTPYRKGGTMWGGDHGCYKKNEPIFDEAYVASAMNSEMMRILESTLDKLGQKGLKVEYLNVTQLSVYREDAHTQIYRTFWGAVTTQQLEDPSKYSDCVHWCLPGLPDIWNEILYAYIMKS